MIPKLSNIPNASSALLLLGGSDAGHSERRDGSLCRHPQARPSWRINAPFDELLACSLNPRALESIIRLRRRGWYRSRQVLPAGPTGGAADSKRRRGVT